MLSRIIYASQCLCSVDDARQLCVDARGSNAANDITGALYLAGQTFLQYLEGDELRLSALYSRIQKDARHTHCRMLDSRLVSLRIFKAWPMAWIPATAETGPVVQALVHRGSDMKGMEGSTAGALFLALSQSAERQ